MKTSDTINIIFLLEAITAILSYSNGFTVAAWLFAACAAISGTQMIVCRRRHD